MTAKRSNKKQKPKEAVVQIALRIDPVLLAQLDVARGLISRAAFVRHIISNKVQGGSSGK